MPEMAQLQKSSRWLQERQRPGNWIDVAEFDEIPPEIEGWYRTVIHMFQIAFAPEIRQRLSAGGLDQTFFLTAAQMIQPETGAQMIRLNGEVRGIANVRATRPVQKGEPVFVSDMQNFVSFDLDEEELDAGHFTLFWTGSGWIATFDFRAGRAKSAAMLKALESFWKSRDLHQIMAIRAQAWIICLVHVNLYQKLISSYIAAPQARRNLMGLSKVQSTLGDALATLMTNSCICLIVYQTLDLQPGMTRTLTFQCHLHLISE